MTISDIVFHGRTEFIFKVIVIGDPAVDKTGLLMNFCSGKFTYKYVPTLGVNIIKELTIIKDNMDQDVTVNLMIWDISGSPQFNMLHRPYFNGADGIILVFDNMRISTFSSINNWWEKCNKYGLRSIPRILVGLKRNNITRRKITLSMTRHLSKKLNAPYFEVSILARCKVKFIFQKMAEFIYKSKVIIFN